MAKQNTTADHSETGGSVVVRVEHKISAIGRENWDRCANPTPETYNPFLSYDFLHALEASGCVRAETGWLPQHLVLEDDAGRVNGCMPCYLKGHSRGEYVFDHGWAEAFEYAGGDYYPKLISAIPFTPVTGRRLLVPSGEHASHHQDLLMSAALQLTEKQNLSSLHVNFTTQDEWAHFGKKGLLQRIDQQFHWHNKNYENFDAFLSSLSSRKRKAIRKERRSAIEDGIEIHWLTGDEITSEHWDAFFEFYQDTGERKWGTPYLNREFFDLLHEAMADKILLIMGLRAGRYIAGALNLIGGDTLYGRYWGTIEHHAFLHFEICYYQAMDFAIAHNIAHVEAGAQGPHKLARGYLPKTTYSLHHITNPSLRDAVENYLKQERSFVEQEQQDLTTLAPFRKDKSADEAKNTPQAKEQD